MLTITNHTLPMKTETMETWHPCTVVIYVWNLSQQTRVSLVKRHGCNTACQLKCRQGLANVCIIQVVEFICFDLSIYPRTRACDNDIWVWNPSSRFNIHLLGYEVKLKCLSKVAKTKLDEIANVVAWIIHILHKRFAPIMCVCTNIWLYCCQFDMCVDECMYSAHSYISCTYTHTHIFIYVS